MRVPTLLCTLAIVMGGVLPASAVRAQTPPTPPPAPPPAAPARPSLAYRYRLLGVYDAQSGDPVDGVEVSDFLAGNKALTTTTGTVSLMFLPEGTTLVRLRKVGYELMTIPVTISPADTTPLTMVMTRATQLPTVVVTDSAAKPVSARLTSFEAHRREGMGQFITEDELRRNDSRTMAMMLSGKLTGLHAVAGKSGASYLVSSRKPCSGPALRQCRSPDCYVVTYVDGIRTYDNATGSSTVIDFSRLNVYDYQAVEFYPGGAALPAGITPTNSDCGTLLLWTRDR